MIQVISDDEDDQNSTRNEAGKTHMVYDLTTDEPDNDSFCLARPPIKSRVSASDVTATFDRDGDEGIQISNTSDPVPAISSFLRSDFKSTNNHARINFEMSGIGTICDATSLVLPAANESKVVMSYDLITLDEPEPQNFQRNRSLKHIGDSCLSKPKSTNGCYLGNPKSPNQAAPPTDLGTKRIPDATPATNNELERTTSYEPETLNFEALKALIGSSDSPPPQASSNSRNKGPICCNSWCSCHAYIIPTENVRDYFGIPRGKSYRICHKCKDLYDRFSELALVNYTTGGNMLELQCAHKNDFVVLDDEQSSEDETSQKDEPDLEIEKLLGDAIEESLYELKTTTKQAIDHSKQQVLSNLSSFIQDGELLVKRIQKVDVEMNKLFSEFKNQFNRKVIELPELDIPHSPLQSGSLNVEHNKDFCSHSIHCKKSCHMNAPNVGDTVYCIPTSQKIEWIKFEVKGIAVNCTEDNKIVETFTLETTFNGEVLEKTAESDEIAFCNPPNFHIGVGRRVIALAKNSGRQTLSEQFLSGMISESPSEINQYRYLVFFENGGVQYCTRSDIRLVYKIKKPVYKYFTGDQSNMAMKYLCDFPKRKMCVVDVGQRIRVEKDGFLVYCKVEKVDASLIFLKYYNDFEPEWLYRGSPKLCPPPSGQIETLVPKNRRVFRIGNPALKDQFIDITNEDDDISDSSPVPGESESATQEQAVVLDKCRTRGKKNVNVFTKFPPNMLTPHRFQAHSCSVTCVHWVRYDRLKTNGVGLLAIPSIFAFVRNIVRNKVKYTAPCGVVLSNMQEVLDYLSLTLIPLTLEMFSFSLAINIFDEWIPHPQHELIKDISMGIENIPIPCINEIGNDCPTLMNYITERRPNDGVFINQDPGFLISCDCVDKCAIRSVCRCWQLNVECFLALNTEDVPLSGIGYNYQRLENPILSGIYECNSNCKCSATCINRVVQHPLRNKLQLFKTLKTGWGIRCLNDIPSGTFICVYVARVYTEEQANDFGTIEGDEYLAELDHIEIMEASKPDYESDVDSPPHKKQSSAIKQAKKTDTTRSLRMFYGPNEGPYILDAKTAGNIGRFFNHSCSPNMFVQNVFVDTHDLRFPWVAYFASKDIPAGSELTWNYGYSIESVPGKTLFCHCGSANCVRRLL